MRPKSQDSPFVFLRVGGWERNVQSLLSGVGSSKSEAMCLEKKGCKARSISMWGGKREVKKG